MVCEYCGRIKMNVNTTRYFYHLKDIIITYKGKPPVINNNIVYNFIYIEMIIIRQKLVRNESLIKMSYVAKNVVE